MISSLFGPRCFCAFALKFVVIATHYLRRAKLRILISLLEKIGFGKILIYFVFLYSLLYYLPSALHSISFKKPPAYRCGLQNRTPDTQAPARLIYCDDDFS